MSANETLTSKRNSSIELLRIVAMIGVILLHYNNKTYTVNHEYWPIF